jgi:ribosome-associated heat shock protein Hsp15
MRIDKFLWDVRVYKTRTLATEACRNGRVSIREQEVKPAREVAVGDVIVIKLHAYTRTIQIVDFPKSRVGAKLLPNYIIELTPKEEFKKLDMVRERLVLQRPKGTGRPTKRDRRELDEWMEEE